MGKFFRKDNEDNTKPEDFVLFKEENNPSEAVQEDFQDTSTLDTAEINRALQESRTDDDIAVGAKAHFGEGIIAVAKSHKIWTACICFVLAVAIITGSAFGIATLANPLRGYVQYSATKENIINTMTASGILETGDKYEIVSLVSGKITQSDFQIGDTVATGDVLFKLDDTEAKLALERAKNEYDKASDSTAGGLNSDTGRIIASETGKITSLNIRQGSTVVAGSQIGTLQKSDGSTTPIISYVSGSVMVVSSSSGRSVTAGQLIASVKLSGSLKDTSTYDKKSGEIDIRSAERNLENYTIKSPIDGVIIEKNSKVGDNVGDANSAKAMMVVLDTSKLTFTFGVDQSRVNEVKRGQSVTLTSPSVPDTKFMGEVSSVGLEGKIDADGVTRYDVKISVFEPENLKSGMKVDAKIILDTANSSIAVPQDALLKSDGHKALVIVKDDGSSQDNDVTESMNNRLAHPDIKVPDGCQLLTVEYGISDGSHVQIISGIKIGDIVVYDPDKDYGEFVRSTAHEEDDDNDLDSFDSFDSFDGFDDLLEEDEEDSVA